jgi:hypothetical protein
MRKSKKVATPQGVKRKRGRPRVERRYLEVTTTYQFRVERELLEKFLSEVRRAKVIQRKAGKKIPYATRIFQTTMRNFIKRMKKCTSSEELESVVLELDREMEGLS